VSLHDPLHSRGSRAQTLHLLGLSGVDGILNAHTPEEILAYLGLFAFATITGIGIVGPGDGALVAAAIAAAEGKLDLVYVLTAGFCGGVLGVLIGYRVGSARGRPLLELPGPFLDLRRSLLAKGDAQFAKYGAIASFIVPSTICGVKRVPFRTFVVFAALSRLWWALSFGLVAFYLGEDVVQLALRTMHLHPLTIAALLGLIVVAARWLWVQRRPSTRGRPSSTS
jgi:membrane protein DedA with SNARE-associated domain